jgi:hypothetical protein
MIKCHYLPSDSEGKLDQESIRLYSIYIDSCLRRNDNNIVNYIDPAFREGLDDKKMRKFANQSKMGIYLKTSFALF